jgi:hypothetical protein
LGEDSFRSGGITKNTKGKENKMSIYDKEAPTGDYLNINKLEAKKATVRFFGEPICYEKETDFDGKKEVKTRFATLLLFRDPKTKTSEVKVYEFGWSVQKVLRQFAQDADLGDPIGYDMTISVEGEKLTTKYTIIPRAVKPLSDDDKDTIKACTIDLRKAVKADDPNADPPFKDEAYNPFQDE